MCSIKLISQRLKSFKNDLILRAAKGEATKQIPVWMMRQAGRVLPEYRAVRQKAKNFVEFVKNPDLAAEVTIQPVDHFGVDAAIIFSDILVIPEAMGLPYTMVESKGPFFEKTIESIRDIDRLFICQEDTIDYVNKAIKLTVDHLQYRVPLIGFAGAPWTILAYMVEGSGSKTFSKAKKFLYTRPDLAHKLLQKITDSTINYLRGQQNSGTDLLQIFDSWAGVLSPKQFEEFSLKYLLQICNAFHNVPITIFAKGAFWAVESLANSKCSVVGLDWNTDIQYARKLAGNKTLQGNLDPCLLYADFSVIEKETNYFLESIGQFPHIMNLGHGLYPDIEKEKALCFVETVKKFRR